MNANTVISILAAAMILVGITAIGLGVWALWTRRHLYYVDQKINTRAREESK